MRRWNGWGDDTLSVPLPAGALEWLAARAGAASPVPDASLAQALAAVPPSRLPPHRLVRTDALERLLHARGQSLPDWIALRGGRIERFPDGVARPSSEEEVRALLHYAAQTDARLIPYGGGTSVVGHVNPGAEPTLTVNLRGLNRLRRLDAESRLASFGAGAAGPEIEAALRARGFTLGHYPQSFEYSTLGGWVATRSAGQESLGYGRIEQLFAGGRLETPAGRLALPCVPASAAGPDLRALVLGSEGRLGIVTEATVRIAPLPERQTVTAVFFPAWSAGLAAAREIAQATLPLTMLRLSHPAETETTLALAGDSRGLRLLRRMIELRGLGEGRCLLLAGAAGGGPRVRRARGELLALARRHGGVRVTDAFGRRWRGTRFRAPYLRNALWEHGYALDALETALPWARVPALVEAVERALREAAATFGERLHVFTHLSHLYPTGSSVYTTYLFRVAVDPDETLARWRACKRAASEAIVAAGGTISHQHGVGLDHQPYLAAEKGELGVAALQALCRQFDPRGVMNPGKLVE